MDKKEIRSMSLAARNNMPAEEKKLYDERLRKLLFDSLPYRKCENLLCYVSFNSEIDTHEIIRHSLALGKRVYLPKVLGSQMHFYRINSLEGLVPSKFGVPEPIADDKLKFYADNLRGLSESRDEIRNDLSDDFSENNSKAIFEDINNVRNRPDEVDSIPVNLMLLPGLAFDCRGNRIGYGAGYYDRYLQLHRASAFYKIALAYDFQLFDSIEAHEHDIAVDMIITPTRTIITGKR